MRRLPPHSLGSEGAGVKGQPCFPGFEAFFRPVELSRGAHRLLRILRWFQRKAKEIRVGQQWLADRLGVSLRSVNRWFSELRAAGAEILEWRGPNPPLISVDGVAFGVAFAAPISITQSTQPNPKPAAPPRRSLPEFITDVLERAKKRIQRAKNPAAYRQSIIGVELRLMKQAGAEHPPKQRVQHVSEIRSPFRPRPQPSRVEERPVEMDAEMTAFLQSTCATLEEFRAKRSAA